MIYEKFKNLSTEEKKEIINNLDEETIENSFEDILNLLTYEPWTIKETLLNKLRDFSSKDILNFAEKYIVPGNKVADLRNAAMEIITDFKEESIPLLKKLLKSESPDIKIYTVGMLGDIKSVKSIEPLLTAIDDPNENVAHTAIESLGKIESPEVVPHLLRILNTTEDVWIQYPAIMILGKLKDERAVTYLVNQLENEFLQELAIDALGQICSKTSVHHLINLMLTYEDLTQPVLIALSNIFKKDSFKEVTDFLISHSYWVKLNDSKYVIEIIRNMFVSTELTYKEVAILWTGWLQIKLFVPQIIKSLEEDFFHYMAYSSMNNFDNDLINELTPFLTYPNKFVRRYIVKLLGLRKTSLNTMTQFLSDPEDFVRTELALSLPEYGDNAIPVLLEMLNDKNDSVINAALLSLEKLKGTKLSENILNILETKNYTIENISYIINLSGTLKINQALPYLEELYNTHSEKNIKLAIIKNLLSINFESGLKLINKYITGIDDELTIEVLKSLYDINNKNILNFVTKFLDSDNNEIKYHVYYILSYIKHEESLIILVNSLKKENKIIIKAVILNSISKFPDNLLNNYRNNIIEFIKNRENINNNDINRKLLEIIGKLELDNELSNFIKQNLISDNWSLRTSALKIVSEKKDPIFKKDIKKMLLFEKDELVLEDLIQAIISINIDSGLEILLNRFPRIPEKVIDIISNNITKFKINDWEFIAELFPRLPSKIRVAIGLYVSSRVIEPEIMLPVMIKDETYDIAESVINTVINSKNRNFLKYLDELEKQNNKQINTLIKEARKIIGEAS